MSKLLKLTKGQYATVDDEDYDYLMQWKWRAYYSKNSKSYYAVRTLLKSERVGGKRGSMLMHRQLMACPKGLTIDHTFHDTLDNRKENLRICTLSQNQMNRGKQSNNTSGYKGVSLSKNKERWMAKIKVDRVETVLGYFDCPKEAYSAYCEANNKLHGEYGRLS